MLQVVGCWTRKYAYESQLIGEENSAHAGLSSGPGRFLDSFSSRNILSYPIHLTCAGCSQNAGAKYMATVGCASKQPL